MTAAVTTIAPSADALSDATAIPLVRSAPPRGAATGTVSDDEVVWFGASRRIVAGRPDTRYGWLPRADGRPCIVKAMDPSLAAYNATLLDHERRVLARLGTLGAPVPEVVDLGRADWLVTRFAGLSLQRAAHPGGLHGAVALSCAERLGAWIHALRRLHLLGAHGVLVADVHEANVVLPLTSGTRGQLRLHAPVLIDHAHTLEVGGGLRRPVWIDRRMRRIAPELRQALAADQDALIARLREAGAEPPGHSRLPGERDAASRRLWAEYDAPQALQKLLDAGRLSADRAMQFAAAAAIAPLVDDPALRPRREALARVLGRMGDPSAARRLGSLSEAADALANALGDVPMVGERDITEIGSGDLMSRPVQTAGATAVATASERDETGTVGEPAAANEVAGSDSTRLRPVRRRFQAAAWWVAAAAGAGAGAALALLGA